MERRGVSPSLVLMHVLSGNEFLREIGERHAFEDHPIAFDMNPSAPEVFEAGRQERKQLQDDTEGMSEAEEGDPDDEYEDVDEEEVRNSINQYKWQSRRHPCHFLAPPELRQSKVHNKSQYEVNKHRSIITVKGSTAVHLERCSMVACPPAIVNKN
eukprot:GHVO01050922.1.p1 GENE.GHVO01050922.1~~GHVO01050922.1.p1  ORF type:complete len:156 (+),score=24.88 GHVO01050922.1:23-490(+)